MDLARSTRTTITSAITFDSSHKVANHDSAHGKNNHGEGDPIVLVASVTRDLIVAGDQHTPLSLENIQNPAGDLDTVASGLPDKLECFLFRLRLRTRSLVDHYQLETNQPVDHLNPLPQPIHPHRIPPPIRPSRLLQPFQLLHIFRLPFPLSLIHI